MTPISSSTSSFAPTSATPFTDFSRELNSASCLPSVLFCEKNQENLKAILASKNANTRQTARIFEVCFKYRSQGELNKAIKEIVAAGGSVEISDHVRQMLRDLGIDVIQNPDETIELTRFVAVIQSSQRAAEIDTVVSSFLPGSLVLIVEDYDAQIRICPANSGPISEMFFAGGSARESVKSAAREQNQAKYLRTFEFLSQNLRGIGCVGVNRKHGLKELSTHAPKPSPPRFKSPLNIIEAHQLSQQKQSISQLKI
ncbi:hypothetical protein AAKU67_002157 [Oxalobacteraceae bacterium GrIS 2.11]